MAVGLAPLLCGCPVIDRNLVELKDAANKPYQGGWAIDACHDKVNATGNQEGTLQRALPWRINSGTPSSCTTSATGWF